MSSVVYVAQFNNGESYSEDFHEWIDDRVYLDKEECIQSILDRGYEYNSYDSYLETDTYVLKEDNPWADNIASVVELAIELKLDKSGIKR